MSVMVSRIVKFLNRPSNGINEAALLLGSFALISQLLGLVRDRLLATYLGAGTNLDLYYAAFKIPDFLYISVATLASITVLLPYLSERYSDGQGKSIARAKKFLNGVFTVLLGFLVILSIILFIAMPWLAKLIAPGFSAHETATLVMLSRIMLLQPIIIGISNMVSSVTQMFRRFFVAALSPVFYNVGIIVGVIGFYPMFGIVGLAYGVVLGAILHFLIQVPVLVYHHFVPEITSEINWKEIKQVALVSIPRTIGLSISSFTVLIFTAIASGLNTGSISIFSLTNNMLNVPIGIIGISYSVASFPVLVKFFNTKEDGKFALSIINAARKIIFWSIPITILFIVLRAQIVRVILGTQSFSWDNTRIAAACLALFVIGLVAQSLVHLLVRGYYAAANTKTPLVMNVMGEVITIILAFVFIGVIGYSEPIAQFLRDALRLGGIIDVRILALPLAFSIGNIFKFSLLWSYFKRDFPNTRQHSLVATTTDAFLASMCMGVASYAALYGLSFIFNQNTFWGIFGQGAIAGIVGFAVFVLALLLMENKDIAEFGKALSRKFWKSQVVQEIDRV